MVKPVPRTKTLGMKLTAEEYAGLVAQAGEKPVSEWAREVLLRQGGVARDAGAAASVGEGHGPDVAGVLLGEVLALRAVLLNLFYAVARGERITQEQMRELIERADADKHRKAQERLAASGAKR